MKSLLRNLMLFLASIFTSTFILPLVILLVIFPLILYRKLILSLASYKTDLYRHLNVSSSVFSWDDMYRRPTCSICLALYLKNKHDINQVIGRLESIVEKYPELSCTLHRWMGTIFWKKSPTFQLSRHLTINEESDPEKITHYLDTLPEKPYRKDAPLWEFVSLPNYENGTKSALILRLHHSLGDGLACISVLSDFCDNKGGHTVLENIKGKFHKKKPPSWPRRFLNFLQLIFITPTEFAYLLLKGIDSNPLTIQVPDRSGEMS
ncbi:uncharacterized protein LOC110858966 [Folsomia candida]|uniref:uncharacterized protein LOC110858966 n=1 Tax=Folsomia candida TaxID=158441 RepID=UPI001604F7B6|nr:uncharacterized protein LOC110858966 [Folsomia candida]